MNSEQLITVKKGKNAAILIPWGILFPAVAEARVNFFLPVWHWKVCTGGRVYTRLTLAKIVK